MQPRLVSAFVALALFRPTRQQTPLAPDFDVSYTNYSTALRAHLLSSYDKVVPPESNRPSVNYSNAGTDVRMQINFFKVEGVDTANAKMRLKVWLRLTWQDQRLSWDPQQWGGITKTFFQGKSVSFPEETEIWLPDVQPLNSGFGIDHTLDASLARVTSSGEVFWSRPGVLDVLCRFSGLVAFPFDNLKCSLEFGGWAFSGGQQGIELLGTGWVDAQQEATSGSSYQEYWIENVKVVPSTFVYPCCPNEPWPVVRYDLQMGRSTVYYVLLVVYPNLLITLLAMAVFFMSPGLSERLSYSTTLLLVNEVGKVTIAGLVPICGELLWVEIFSSMCTVFCTLALLESAFVLYLFNHTEEHLLPQSFFHWYHYTGSRCRGLQRTVARMLGWGGCAASTEAEEARERGMVEARELEKEVEFESSAAVFYRRIYGNRYEEGRAAEADELAASLRETSQQTEASSASPQWFRKPPEPPPRRVRSPPTEGGTGPATPVAAAYGVDDPYVAQHAYVRRMEEAPGSAFTFPAAPHLEDDANADADEQSRSSLSGRHGVSTASQPAVSAAAAPGPKSFEDGSPHSKKRHSRKSQRKMLTERQDEMSQIPLAFNTADLGDAEGTRRLMLIENAFFMLDVQARGWIHLREVSRFLSFARLDMGPLERHTALWEGDKHGDCRFVRLEFMDVCVHCLSDVTCREIELALRNFELAQSMFNRRFARKWRKAAEKIDSAMRLVPAIYIVLVVLLCNITLDDNYAPTFDASDGTTPMFQGPPPIITFDSVGKGVVGLVLVPAMLIMVTILLWLDRKYLKYLRGAETSPEKKRQQLKARMATQYSNPDIDPTELASAIASGNRDAVRTSLDGFEDRRAGRSGGGTGRSDGSATDGTRAPALATAPASVAPRRLWPPHTRATGSESDTNARKIIRLSADQVAFEQQP